MCFILTWLSQFSGSQRVEFFTTAVCSACKVSICTWHCAVKQSTACQFVAIAQDLRARVFDSDVDSKIIKRTNQFISIRGSSGAPCQKPFNARNLAECSPNVDHRRSFPVSFACSFSSSPLLPADSVGVLFSSLITFKTVPSLSVSHSAASTCFPITSA